MTGRNVVSPHWEHFHHVADIGVRGVASTVGQAFAQAAIALTAVLTDPALVNASTAIPITCRAQDYEYLLVDWLNALIYEMATRHMLFIKFSINIAGENLTATAWGEAVDIERHAPAVEIKGATYTALKVYQKQGLWIAQCVVDV